MRRPTAHEVSKIRKWNEMIKRSGVTDLLNQNKDNNYENTKSV